MAVNDRQDSVAVSASITDAAGLLSLGRWEDRSGGQSDSAAVTYARAGVGGRTPLGGRQEVANVIIKRLFDDEMRAVIGRLRKGAGNAAMSVSEQGTDKEGNVEGPVETWHGILKNVHVSDRSTESNAAATIELEMVVDGEVVVSG
jgi:hypothetical protein